MLSNILNSQKKFNQNEIERILKITKKTNQKNVKQEIMQREKTFSNIFLQTLNKYKYIDHFENNNIISREIKIIHLVYKFKYLNGYATGFGDFIRGSLYLLQFCEKHLINFDFDIYEHPIGNYLHFFAKKQKIDHNISNYISKFLGLNAYFKTTNQIIDYLIILNSDENFIRYINNLFNYNGHIFINTCNFPSHYISDKHRKIMQNILIPTNEINEEIEKYIFSLNFQKYNYIVYHIRMGDSYLKNETDFIDLSKINYFLNKIKQNNNDNCLLITDCNPLKKIITKSFPNIKYLFYDICHTSENKDELIKNTLIDFFLMSYSKAVICFSTYPHGSGFSKWCSVVYNIPYICYYLD